MGLGVAIFVLLHKTHSVQQLYWGIQWHKQTARVGKPSYVPSFIVIEAR